MAKKTNGNFTHATSIGANGEILYDCPIEIKDTADLDNYGITWDDCKTLNFHGDEYVMVYFYKTESMEFAKSQWSYLNTQHSRRYASIRCMIPGQQRAFIKCPDTNSCMRCPYDHKPEDKHASVISWDELIESGYDPALGSNIEEQVHAKLEYSAIHALMDEENVQLATAFEMKELYGYSVKEIAKNLKVSEPRVYQLIARAKAIGRDYRMNNA